MLYLTWSLLNTAAFIFLMYICFKATKLLKEKMGWFAAAFFVFSLLSFVNENGDTKSKTSHSGSPYGCHVILDNEKTYHLEMYIYYKKAGDSLLIPVSATVFPTGFLTGFIWEQGTTSLSADKNQITYQVQGSVDWKLIGATIYREPKIFSGKITPEIKQ